MSAEIDHDGSHDREPEFGKLYKTVFDAFTQHDAPTMTVAVRRMFAAGVRLSAAPRAASEPAAELAEVPLFDLEEAGA